MFAFSSRMTRWAGNSRRRLPACPPTRNCFHRSRPSTPSRAPAKSDWPGHFPEFTIRPHEHWMLLEMHGAARPAPAATATSCVRLVDAQSGAVSAKSCPPDPISLPKSASAWKDCKASACAWSSWTATRPPPMPGLACAGDPYRKRTMNRPKSRNGIVRRPSPGVQTRRFIAAALLALGLACWPRRAPLNPPPPTEWRRLWRLRPARSRWVVEGRIPGASGPTRRCLRARLTRSGSW